jgi:anthranilate synthase/aminodeoxychorismate synthase-like glutamine amidotransferase
LGSRRLDERAWEALGAEKARRKIEGVMVFVLDTYDSFTYNLVQYMGELGAEVVVRRNDEVTPEEVVAMRPDRILLSPGPCTPQDAGILIPLIQHLAKLPKKEQIPVLGVCLGHQAMGAAFGGDVIRAPQLCMARRAWWSMMGERSSRGFRSR